MQLLCGCNCAEASLGDLDRFIGMLKKQVCRDLAVQQHHSTSTGGSLARNSSVRVSEAAVCCFPPTPTTD